MPQATTYVFFSCLDASTVPLVIFFRPCPTQSHPRPADLPPTSPNCRETSPRNVVDKKSSEAIDARTSAFVPSMASINFPVEEERILKYWEEIKAFQRQLELSKHGRPYVFYDGPPFATGTPHYGHLLTSTIKDIIPRYWSMTGRHVERRFGWDTHGVPIEQIIDKQLQEELGVRGQAAVEKIGIKEYNRRCREVVLTYAGVWRKVIGRLGRWIDFDNDYKTMDPGFMETLWWVFKQLHNKGYVYHGAKVLPYSTALNTPLSKSEATEEYKDVQDPAVTVSFPVLLPEDQPESVRAKVKEILNQAGGDVSFVAWTTTPWTLPSNTALCAHPDYEYLVIHDMEADRRYIMLEAGLKVVFKDPKKAKYKTLLKIRGIELAGWRYKPLFDFFCADFKDFGFKLLLDTYVKQDEGVGIVHQAPAFGEDDYNIGWREKVITQDRQAPNPLTASGEFTAEVPDFQGQYLKSADKNIIKAIENMGRMVRKSQITHRYPYCPRSKTPLIQRAVPSWFIKVESVVPRLLANLEKTHWVPRSVGSGRFYQWLAAAKDWNVSRNRYWGTPLPLWVSDDMKEVVCIGSIAELKALSGFDGEIKDLHPDSVNDITIPSQQGNGILKRVPEVFDCWFESGSMPYASAHYPFEFPGFDPADPASGTSRDDEPGRALFTKFPGNFIAEGLDQTRGWFYTMSLLGTFLFDTFPYQNCVVNGIVLAEDGKKMSKSLQNFPDPNVVIDRYGSDALRLYLIDSPVVRGDPIRFSETGVKQIVSGVLLPLWNSYNFFAQQTALLRKQSGKGFVFDADAQQSNHNVMDRWILAATQSLIAYVNQEMEGYRLYTVVPRLLKMVDDITNWYIRFNRARLKGQKSSSSTTASEVNDVVNGNPTTGSDAKDETTDTVHALNTLFEVLYTLVRVLAPFIPFLSDNIFQRLAVHLPASMTEGKDVRSVHFLSFPAVRQELFDPVVERRVGRMQKVIELGRLARERRTVSLKTQLKTVVVLHQSPEFLDDVRTLSGYITDELNVRDLVLTSEEGKYGVEYDVKPDVKSLGIKFKKDAAKIKSALPQLSPAEITAFLETGTVTVQGHELGSDDLRVQRRLRATDDNAHIEVAADGDILVLLDAFAYPELAQEGLAREVLNRVQRMRKRAGLVPTDDVRLEWMVLGCCGEYVRRAEGQKMAEEMFAAHKATFDKAASRGVGKVPEEIADSVVVVEEEVEVREVYFLLRIVKV